jgi:outer membrane autotransporter protein
MKWVKLYVARKDIVKTSIFVVSGLMLMGSSFSAQAGDDGSINCTGAITAPRDTSYVFYDASAGICRLSDGEQPMETGDVRLEMIPGDANVSGANFKSDSNLDGSFAYDDNLGGVVGDSATVGENGWLQDGNVARGQAHTNWIKAKVSEDTIITLTVEYHISVNITSQINVISASFTREEVESSSDDSSSADSGAPKTPPSLQASVSRSQTTVVSTNIGTRLASVGSSPVGVGRTVPGAGRNVPTGNAPTSTGGTTTGGTTSAPDSEQNNFSSYNEQRTSNSTGYDKLPLRQLAMAMSFDSSEMILAAAGDDTSPVLAPEQRASLLADRPLTVWGHGSFTDVTNTRNDNTGDSRYGGDVWGYNLGMDYRLQPNLYVGASVGFNQTALNTTYNSGTYDEDSWTLTPYVVYKPFDALKLSGMFGYGLSDIDQTRNSGSVTSSTESAMWFAAANAAYTVKPAEELPLDLKASFGVLVTNKKVDAYTESDGTQNLAATSNTRQIKPGLEAAYSLNVDDNTVLQPFVKTDWVYDFKNPVNRDANAFDVGGGLRIGSTTGFNGSLEGNTQLGRKDYKEYTISGMIAYSFELSSDGQNSFIQPYVESNFTKDVQIMGTGLVFKEINNALETKIGFSQTAARASDAKDMEAKLSLDIKF